MRVLKRLQDMLPTELTQEEFNARAAKLAETHEALALEREMQKEQKADMKLRLEKLEKLRTELARVVRSRKEDRSVDVEWHADDRKGVVELVRMDTGEVFERRSMQSGERQLDAFGPPAAASAPANGTATVTFTDPDTGKSVTLTTEELARASKRIKKAAMATRQPTTH